MSADPRPGEHVAELERRLARLAYEARTGDPAINAELSEVEEELAAHERMLRLDALAREEHKRREAEQVEHDRQAQEVRDARALAQALEKRDDAVRKLQHELAALDERVRALVDADVRAAGAARRAGQPFRSLKQTAAEMVVIASRDAGLDKEPIGYVRASVRASLLKAYPSDPGPSRISESPNMPGCTVCSHSKRVSLEAALASGMSYREAAACFDVSRSAIGRHAKHSADLAQ